MNEHIVRGTDASLLVDFADNPDGITVQDVTAVSFTAKQRAAKHVYGLSDFIVVGNALQFNWTQEMTFALKAGEKLKLEMDIVAKGKCSRLAGIPKQVDVWDSERSEVL